MGKGGCRGGDAARKGAGRPWMRGGRRQQVGSGERIGSNRGRCGVAIEKTWKGRGGEGSEERKEAGGGLKMT